MEVVALTPRHGGAWAELFEASSVACFCRYWHFDGTKNEWLARCAHEARENLREHLASLEAGEPVAGGLLALEESVAVGWMKLVPRPSVAKLTKLPVYRSYPPREGAYVIGCLLVRPDRRRHGIGRALVLAADAHVLARGGLSIEAYPRHTEGPLHDEEAWMGPERVFLDCGYARVAGEGPYPIYRKALTNEAIM